MAEGPEGLADRSRAPHESPNKISLALRREILSLREKHPTWGPKKLRRILKGQSPSLSWPAASTIGELLKREGCVTPRPKRRSVGLPIDSALTKPSAPNDVWSADFKGEFRLRDGSYCFPLTVQDASSRYLIGATALSSTASVPVEIAFARHFEEFGLPRVIRTDNGVPFATPRGLGRISRLSLWWIKLGIRPERIEPGEPQQNGTHERMHQTLKAEATRPPGHQERVSANSSSYSIASALNTTRSDRMNHWVRKLPPAATLSLRDVSENLPQSSTTLCITNWQP